MKDGCIDLDEMLSEIAELEKENAEFKEQLYAFDEEREKLRKENAELEKENAELKRDKQNLRADLRTARNNLQAKDTAYQLVMEELEYAKSHCLFHSDCPTQKENAELKKDNEGYEKDNTRLVNQFNQTSAKLIKAKELLKWFVWYFREGSPNLVPYKHKVAEAEQFLNSEVEK